MATDWTAGLDVDDDPVAPSSGRGPVTTEIEGRVLVCTECANDEELREHARKDWR